ASEILGDGRGAGYVCTLDGCDGCPITGTCPSGMADSKGGPTSWRQSEVRRGSEVPSPAIDRGSARGSARSLARALQAITTIPETRMSLTRRDFLGAGAAAAASSVIAGPAAASIVDRAERLTPGSSPFRARPAVVSSANGIRGVARAFEMIQSGADPLDAVIAGVNIQELDPEDPSVGLGGLPNADGVVQLDASCMHGPTRRAGAVGCLEGIATPSLVAKAIMDYTDHIMMVGDDAKRFALDMGFEEQELLTESTRQIWLRWKA